MESQACKKRYASENGESISGLVRMGACLDPGPDEEEAALSNTHCILNKCRTSKNSPGPRTQRAGQGSRSGEQNAFGQ
jgi:hypothetical protein